MITRHEAIDIANTKTKGQVKKMLEEIESFIREEAQKGYFHTGVDFGDDESSEARKQVFDTLVMNGFDVEWVDDGIAIYWGD